MKTLNEYLKENKLSDIDLKHCVQSIINYEYENKERKNDIDLNLDNILVGKNMNLKLTLKRESEHDFSFNFSQFMVRLLRHVDTTSIKALRLAYGLFVASSKREFKISDIEEVLYEIEVKDTKEELMDCGLTEDEADREMEDYDLEIEEGFRENMPCDTYGMCGGESCSNFYKCNIK